MKPLGKCSLKLRNPATQKKYRAKFVVVQGPAMSILGARTVRKMGLGHTKKMSGFWFPCGSFSCVLGFFLFFCIRRMRIEYSSLALIHKVSFVVRSIYPLF